MSFRELLELLSRRIGHHQIPVNPAASELRGLIDSGAVHYELITQIVTALYTGNRCRRLKDPVTQDATFEALEPIRLAVLRAPGTDVDSHALMEAICVEVAHAFDVTAPGAGPAAPSSRGELVRFRRRLRF
ncbi:MAG TPA: hypothetical protein DIC36_04730 [Gammaproteobacteria bacterium]|nr:hypothetical protein [Gammaproteobacteria bacterium]